MPETWTSAMIAASTDHTLLKAIATENQVISMCREAKLYALKAVCVNPYWVSTCARELAGSEVFIVTVVGFPLGATSTVAKSEEARHAVEEGAREIDMVINIGKAKTGDWTAVQDDIAAVVHASKPAIVKTIIETCYLTKDEKVAACRAAVAAGAAFVMTSTGFGTGGATVEDIRLMKEAVGDRALVKASGGIKTYEDAVALLEAGASRIGASAGVAIIRGAESQA